ncbi:MAG: DUF2786 domain-containing protein [Candidatus Didemnitutus sp.]|nr:DUF2786 domain-containing protein [Candidatus Didemnitutus sp.]
MSTGTEIIEKIKKLLRLSRSSNPHEAQLALTRALELAREHGIAVEKLNPDEQAKENVVTHRDTENCQRLSYDKEYAIRICAAFFRITPVLSNKIGTDRFGFPCVVKFTRFVGTASDVQIALYVYSFLVHHFAYCWRKHRGRLRNRHAFVDGMFHGIYNKLAEAQPEFISSEHALVERSHQDYIEATIGKTTKHDCRTPDGDAKAARWAGYLHGRETNIAAPLKEGERTAPLALK